MIIDPEINCIEMTIKEFSEYFGGLLGNKVLSPEIETSHHMTMSVEAWLDLRQMQNTKKEIDKWLESDWTNSFLRLND